MFCFYMFIFWHSHGHTFSSLSDVFDRHVVNRSLLFPRKDWVLCVRLMVTKNGFYLFLGGVREVDANFAKYNDMLHYPPPMNDRSAWKCINVT